MLRPFRQPHAKISADLRCRRQGTARGGRVDASGHKAFGLSLRNVSIALRTTSMATSTEETENESSKPGGLASDERHKLNSRGSRIALNAGLLAYPKTLRRVRFVRFGRRGIGRAETGGRRASCSRPAETTRAPTVTVPPDRGSTWETSLSEEFVFWIFVKV